MKTLPGDFPLVVPAKNRKSSDHYNFEGSAVCIPLISSSGHGKANIKRLHYQEGKFALADTMCCMIPKESRDLNAKFIFKALDYKKEKILVPLMKGATNVSMKTSDLLDVKIPVPPIDIQNDIVACDRYQMIVDGAKQLIQNYLPDSDNSDDLELIKSINSIIDRMSSKIEKTISVAKIWGE